MTLWDWKRFLTGYSKEIVSCLISHVHSNTRESVMVRERKKRNKTWAEVDHAIRRHKIESHEYPSSLLLIKNIHVCFFYLWVFPIICRKLRINDAGNLIMTHMLLQCIAKYRVYLKLTGLVIRTILLVSFWALVVFSSALIELCTVLILQGQLFVLFMLILRIKVYSVRSEC